jgi:hypothetical protein
VKNKANVKIGRMPSRVRVGPVKRAGIARSASGAQAFQEPDLRDIHREKRVTAEIRKRAKQSQRQDGQDVGLRIMRQVTGVSPCETKPNCGSLARLEPSFDPRVG